MYAMISGGHSSNLALSSSGISIDGKLPFKFIIKRYFGLILTSEEFNHNLAWIFYYWKKSASRCLNSYNILNITNEKGIL
jgi:hypothetical protein